VSFAGTADRRIRGLRPAKPFVDPWRAHGHIVEEERRPSGVVERTATIFLAGAECAFTCSFCDLWRYTIDGPTPRGALPAQLETSLAGLEVASIQRIKLYNASNFFDRRAVPADDLPRIIDLCAPFAGVTVESHAKTVQTGAAEFAGRLSGRLEVAMGLETIHPSAATILNKRLDLEQFDRAVDFLVERGIDVRVFVLLGAPGVPSGETVEWTVRSVEHAARRGAAIVSIIPVRGGNGEMERLQSIGEFTPPTLQQLELALDHSLGQARTTVTADLWDVERLVACAVCQGQRVERMCRVNLTGAREPSVVCSACESS
jgi:radical SAM enzyme (TIGR01210 family)